MISRVSLARPCTCIQKPHCKMLGRRGNTRWMTVKCMCATQSKPVRICRFCDCSPNVVRFLIRFLRVKLPVFWRLACPPIALFFRAWPSLNAKLSSHSRKGFFALTLNPCLNYSAFMRLPHAWASVRRFHCASILMSMPKPIRIFLRV